MYRRLKAESCLLFAIALGMGAPLQAQERSIFTLLPTDGRVLAAGYAQEGALDSSTDFVLPSGQYVQAWELRGTAGEGLVIELESDDFDALLYLSGPEFDTPLSDDDGGEACNARIDVVLPSDGPFQVVASTFSGSSGSFMLTARSEAGPRRDDDECAGGGGMDWNWTLDEVPTDGRVLVDGDVIEDQLSLDDYRLGGDSPAKAWSLLGIAGVTMTIDLLSADFDAMLYAGGPGFDDLLVDDDGAGGCNSRLTITFPEDGEYTVVASNVYSGSTGAFTLRVSSTPEPVGGETCNMGPEGMSDMGSHLEGITAATSLDVGAEVRGRLERGDQSLGDGSYVDAYTLHLEAGTSLTIDLIGTGFDPILSVTGPDGFFANDDDSLGSCNSRLVLTTDTEAGDYKVVVNSIQAGVEGDYLLRALEPPGAMTPGGCL